MRGFHGPGTAHIAFSTLQAEICLVAPHKCKKRGNLWLDSVTERRIMTVTSEQAGLGAEEDSKQSSAQLWTHACEIFFICGPVPLTQPGRPINKGDRKRTRKWRVINFQQSILEEMLHRVNEDEMYLTGCVSCRKFHWTVHR